MMAKGFARMDVTDVHLNQCDASTFDGIGQGDAGMGVSTGIEDDARELLLGMQTPGLVYPVDEHTFVVALAEICRKAIGKAGAFAQVLYIGQCLRPVYLGLARAQQIEIGAIEDHDGFHCGGFPWSSFDRGVFDTVDCELRGVLRGWA